MAIKAAFFDIDGTLVSFQSHQIPASTIQAIEQGYYAYAHTRKRGESYA